MLRNPLRTALLTSVLLSISLMSSAWSQEARSPYEALKAEQEGLRAMFLQYEAKMNEMKREYQVKMEAMEREMENLRAVLSQKVPATEREIEGLRAAPAPRVTAEVEIPAEPAFPRWSLQLDSMWMDVKGLDWHAFDVLLVTGAGVNVRNDRKAKNIDIDSGPTFRGEIGYRLDEKWRIGASGWFFDGEGSTSGRLPPPYGVDMLDDIDSVFSTRDVDFWAEQEFSMWTIDAFATRNFVTGDRGNLDLNFGVKVGLPHHEQKLGHTYYNPSEGRYVTKESQQEAHYSLLAGPGLGFQGRMGLFGPLRLEGFMNQSVLLGKVHQRGAFYDRRGNFIDSSFFTGSKSVGIPVTEARAKFLVDITRNIAFDVGGFFSQWWNMPVAPEVVRGSTTSGWRWEEKERTPRYVGVTFGLTLSH